ncbi:hypothetical protein AXI76_gp133 [Pseudoalteromonas phage H101]|uniref:Uncharacterized protein n=1 Tax=Pseudoalteromonas phage H101 TaxID=1654919 RepID=A0A0H4IN93_9CAUD|nr:hypothetical protein [Pseudoalteromonas sp. S554]YP_009225567.1 hypothetical protein AXI76_gp133 [Pseudoalteromonas phage H101]AKO61034.1 hypothetical protein [Pseudoalteromonas phage H101]TMS80571.1 hypothetical protein CWB65_14490 [Pseudoalteromonas sp. S554]|tara:strand:- start:3514 stop:3759 length:246 start_codon:yes stop_codon:yes gene_type:complete
MNDVTDKALFDLKMFKDIVSQMENTLENRYEINKLILSAQKQGKALDTKVLDTEEFALNVSEAIDQFLSYSKFETFLGEVR